MNPPIPPCGGGDLTDEEFDSIFAHAKRRMVAGRATYGGSFTRADLRTDMVEELLDLMVYAAALIVRIHRNLPQVEGPVSSEFVA